MRVLGIDPGLTRCGLGVVEGSVGRPLQPGRRRRASAPPPDLPTALRLCEIERGVDAWIDEHRPDAVAVERVFSQHNVRTVMGTAQASGIAMVVRRPPRPPGRAAHPQRGEGRGHRQRPRRQGAGRRDGDPAAAARRAAQAGRRRRRAGAGDLPHLARRRPGPDRRGASPAARKERPVIAFVSGTVADVDARAPPSLEVGGVGLELVCTPAHAGHAAGRRARPRCRPAWWCARSR